MSKRSSKNDPRCSFCGRGQNQVEKIITGSSVHICNACVKLCNDVLVEEEHKSVSWEDSEIPKPTEIKKFLDQYVIAQDRAKKIQQMRRYRKSAAYKVNQRKSNHSVSTLLFYSKAVVSKLTPCLD